MVRERSSLQTIPHCRQTPGRRPAKAGDSYELPFTSDQADKPQVNPNLLYVVYINHIPDCMHVPCLLKIIRDYLIPLVFPFSVYNICTFFSLVMSVPCTFLSFVMSVSVIFLYSKLVCKTSLQYKCTQNQILCHVCLLCIHLTCNVCHQKFLVLSVSMI